MTPQTEVIACPACKHLLRVPLDWLGTQVQCPECKAMFRAPVRENGQLTKPELISQPKPAATGPKKKLDAMLLLPAFGLMLCGFASVVANGASLYLFWSHPGGMDGWARDQLPVFRKAGIGVMPTPEQQAQRDAEDVAQLVGIQKWMAPLALLAGAVTLLGGLSITLRRNYRLAKIACIVAALNFPNLCCLPGAIFGLWGLLMLNSDEAREHFGL
jgi:hypothetical protein